MKLCFSILSYILYLWIYIENGDSILNIVAEALANSSFYIILASETYGTQTKSLCSTYQV